MKKIILVDAIHALVIKGEGIYQPLLELLDNYPNKKIVLTNADDEEMEIHNLHNLPYEVFTLKHHPNKLDPGYYSVCLRLYNLHAEEVIYFEHNLEAVESARSVGIKTYHYDSDKKDLDSLKIFLDENL